MNTRDAQWRTSSTILDYVLCYQKTGFSVWSLLLATVTEFVHIRIIQQYDAQKTLKSKNNVLSFSVAILAFRHHQHGPQN